MKGGMRERDSRILSSFANRLRESLPGSAIWAYGSRARGEASPESDFDVCVVTDRLDLRAREIIRRVAWEIGFENDVVIATVKFTRAAFERFPGRASPLVRAILHEGVTA